MNQPGVSGGHPDHRAPRHRIIGFFLWSLFSGFAFVPSALWGNPTGASVVSGTASLSSSGSTLNVVNSNGAIIDWQSFSIRSGETTNFLQPSVNSSVLNEVVGNNPSAIFGTLSSNGHVMLINPNGILVGSSGVINTAGFTASTLNVDNSQFTSGGALQFIGDSTHKIVNLGQITATGGNVYLIAEHIINKGTLTASTGNVGLFASDQVYLTTGANGAGAVRVAPTGVGTGTGITNSGLIQAAQVQLKATGNMYALAINNSGTIRATGASVKNGVIHLTALGGTVQNSGTLAARNPDGSGGTVKMTTGKGGTTLDTGTIDVSSQTAGKTGGLAELTGDDVGVYGNALIDASGPGGGGTVLIGGDLHGANAAVYDALSTYIGEDAVIKADATDSGNGGKVVVWSNDATRFYGSISAQGGPHGGNGGQVETSGGYLEAFGTVNTAAPKGKIGSWLLDPDNLTIETSASGDNVISGSGPDFSAPTTDDGNDAVLDSYLDVTTLDNALNSGDTTITVEADGTITVNAAVIWSTTAGLTLSAGESILVNAGITSTGDGAITLNAGGYIYVGQNVGLSTQGGNVLLNSNSDGLAAGGIFLDTGSSIVTNGGNITLGGGNNADGSAYTGGGTGYAYAVGSNYNTGNSGIVLNSATLDARGSSSGGAITIQGAADGAVDVGDGVDLAGSTVETNHGASITIAGEVNTSSSGNIGVEIFSSYIGTSQDDLASSTLNDTVISITGTIGVAGAGAATGNSQTGLDISNNSEIATSDTTASASESAVTLTGTVNEQDTGAWTDLNGITIESGAIVSVPGGRLSITGKSLAYDSDGNEETGGAEGGGLGDGGTGNGIVLDEASLTAGNLSSTGFDELSMSGSTEFAGSGISLSNHSSLTTGGGSISLIGTSANDVSDANSPVLAMDDTSYISSHGGNISLSGTSLSTNYGGDGDEYEANSVEGIQIETFDGEGASASIDSGGGTISLYAVAGSANGIFGIQLIGSGTHPTLQSEGGNIYLDTANNDRGLNLESAVVDATGGGGAGGVFINFNEGSSATTPVETSDALIEAGTGGITLYGGGLGTGNGPVDIETTTLQSAGAITIAGGLGSSDYSGVYVVDSTFTATNGALSITGHTTGSSAGQSGIDLVYDATYTFAAAPLTAASVTLTGTNTGSSNADSNGIVLDGSILNSTGHVIVAASQITLTGTTASTGEGSQNIAYLDGAVVLSNTPITPSGATPPATATSDDLANIPVLADQGITSGVQVVSNITAQTTGATTSSNNANSGSGSSTDSGTNTTTGTGGSKKSAIIPPAQPTSTNTATTPETVVGAGAAGAIGHGGFTPNIPPPPSLGAALSPAVRNELQSALGGH